MNFNKVPAVTEYIGGMEIGTYTTANRVATWIKQEIPLLALLIKDGRSVQDEMEKAKCLRYGEVTESPLYITEGTRRIEAYTRTFSRKGKPKGCDDCALKELGCHMWRKERSFIHTIFGRLGDLFARNRN